MGSKSNISAKPSNISEKTSINFLEKVSVTSTYKSFLSTHLTSTEKLDTALTIPPDGGWGWIIVVASFMVNFFLDGAIYTFGMFLEEISRSFKVEATSVALANSLMTGFYFISGPVSCAIINRFGFQITGILGGIIGSVAYLITSVIESSVTFFILTLGVMGGFGFGMAYVPSIVVIGFYFGRWRSLATSIAAAGSAAGILSYPLILKGLFSSYDWRRQFRIIAGGCLITSLLALTYKPLKPVYVEVKSEKKAQDPELIYSSQTTKKPGLFTRMFHRFHNVAYPTASQIHKDSTVVLNLTNLSSSSSLFVSTNPLEGSPSSFVHVDSTSRVDSTLPSRLDARTSRLSTVYEDEDGKRGRCRRCCKKCFHWGHRNRPMYRDDIFYTGPSLLPTHSTFSSVMVSPQQSQNQSQVDKVKSAVEYHLSVTRVGVKEKDAEKVHYKCCPESVIRTLVTMLHFGLLKSPSFLLLALSGMFSVLGMYVPFIYLIEKSSECGIGEKEALKFYTVVGISNAVGRVFCGIVATIPRAKPLIISYVTLFICGVVTTSSYFICSVTGHLMFVSIFGATIASLMTLRAPILVDLLGLEALTNAFGIILLFQSFAAFAGLPLAGAIVQIANHSYSAAFIFSGSVIILSAILLVPIKMISDWEKKTTSGIV